MKKNILTFLIVILLGASGILYNLSQHVASVILLVFAILSSIYIFKNNNKTVKNDSSIQDAIDIEGEPEHLIITNPLHGYEKDGCILVYTQKRGFVINGKWIPWEHIGSLTFTNDSLGYHLPNSYQIIMEVNTSPKTYLHIPTGNDLGWTTHTLEEIAKAMKHA